MTLELQKKVNQAVRFLQCYDDPQNPVEIAYSGGKDSDVILQLAKEAGIHFRAIYKNTTIDPPGTIAHVKAMGVEIMQPQMTFFQMIAKKGFPSRHARFCCSILKEYKVLDTSILGIRREESKQRAKRYVEPSACRVYSKTEHVEQIYPILYWTTHDIIEFVQERKIQLAPVYYREDGTIDFSRRLGCLCCPLASINRRQEEFAKYPNMVRAYIRAGTKFWNESPNDIAQKKWFTDIYEYFAVNLFYPRLSKAPLNKTVMFPTDYKELLEKMYNIKL